MRIALQFMAMVLFCGMAAAQQQAVSYRVAGRVVSADGGRPLARATVRLLTADEKENELASAVTDDEGRFAFVGVAAGRYGLEGHAARYITAHYDAHGKYSTAIVTGAGVETESLELRLMQTATVSGKVTDDLGDPVQNAMVELYSAGNGQGAQPTRSQTVQTNDLGEYAISGITPGRYYIEASGRPWYAQVSQGPVRDGAIGIVRKVDPSLNVTYAETYYPGTSDPRGAETMEVRGGSDVDVDLRLPAVPALMLTVPRPDAGPRGTNVQIERVGLGGALEPVSPGGMTRSIAGETQMTGLPPGQYVVKRTDNASGVQRSIAVDMSRGSMELDAGAVARGESGGRLKVSLRSADSGKLPAEVGFALVPVGGEAGQGYRVNEKGEAEVNVEKPGDYYFLTQGRSGYFVREVITEGKRLPDGLVHVEAGKTAAVTVVAAGANGHVSGVVKNDGKAAAGVRVLLLPMEGIENGREFWQDQSDLDGSFSMSGVPVGRYSLAAIVDGWDLEWRTPAEEKQVLAKYLPGAVEVMVTGTAAKIAEPVEAQAR